MKKTFRFTAEGGYNEEVVADYYTTVVEDDWVHATFMTGTPMGVDPDPGEEDDPNEAVADFFIRGNVMIRKVIPGEPATEETRPPRRDVHPRKRDTVSP